MRGIPTNLGDSGDVDVPALSVVSQGPAAAMTLVATFDHPILVRRSGADFRCWMHETSDSIWWIMEVDGEEHELSPASPGDNEAWLQAQVATWYDQLGESRN